MGTIAPEPHAGREGGLNPGDFAVRETGRAGKAFAAGDDRTAWNNRVGQ